MLAMASSRFIATSCPYISVLRIVATLLHNGPIVERVRCPGNGMIQCDVDKPTEIYVNVSLGQCNAGCIHIADCSWFNLTTIWKIDEAFVSCLIINHMSETQHVAHCTRYTVFFCKTVCIGGLNSKAQQ